MQYACYFVILLTFHNDVINYHFTNQVIFYMIWRFEQYGSMVKEDM